MKTCSNCKKAEGIIEIQKHVFCEECTEKAFLSSLKAVSYLVGSQQTDPDLRYQIGPGSQAFYLLCRAEADYRGIPLKEVEADRSRDLQPHYNRREPEILALRKQICELQEEIG
jgi:hypothetical protein